jgi:DNA repair protein RecO (recombination protein O)
MQSAIRIRERLVLISMPLHKTLAITLKSRRWGEADRIVTLYAQRLGKIRAVARGIRRSKSRSAGSLEPFVLCHLDLFEKPGDTLYRISQSDLVEFFPRIREDLDLMAAAARMANVVSAVTADGDPQPALFQALAESLRSLQEGGDPALGTLLFQIRVLGLTGFKPQTDHCAACGTDALQHTSLFSPAAGGMLCGRCAARQPVRSFPLSKGSVAFLRQAMRLSTTVARRLKAVGQVRSELESALEAYLTAVAGGRLHTPDFRMRGDGPLSARAAEDRLIASHEGVTRS